MIEDFEVYFMKEQVTRGYIIQKQDKQDDYLYFIYRGVCKIIYPTSSMSFFGESAYYDKDK